MASKRPDSKQTSANVPAAKPARSYVRTRADHASELAEDYVELIDDLIREAGEARAVDIASRLGVSHVTVANTVRRLKRDGLVTSEPYRAVFLTKSGKHLAQSARARHTLVLDFLLALGVPEMDAETDAEGIEHHLSKATMDAIRRFLRKKG